MREKTIKIPVFKKGDYVIDTEGEVGIVLRTKDVVLVEFKTATGEYEITCLELKHITKAQWEAAQPNKLNLKTLDRELVLTDGRLRAGCQHLSAADTKLLKAFLNKHIK